MPPENSITETSALAIAASDLANAAAHIGEAAEAAAVLPVAEGEAAVEIARIEAARDVALAEIHSETVLAVEAERADQIDELAEAITEGEKTWQETAEELATNLRELSLRVEGLFSSIHPPQDPEPDPEDPDPSLSTHEFTSAPTTSTTTDPASESADESPAPDPVPDPPARVRRIPI